MERKPSEVRRGEIIEAAMHIISARGAKRFTAQLVADQVGMTPGALFRHFSSMDDIVDGVVDHLEASLFEGFPPTANDPWERLHAFFDHRVRVIASHPDFGHILLADPLSQLGGEKPAARIREFKRRTQQFVTRCLQDASDAGTLANQVTVRAASIVVTGAIAAVGQAAGSRTSKRDASELPAAVWNVINMMRRAPGRPRPKT